MSGRDDFYQRVHEEQPDYSGAAYNVNCLTSTAAFCQWLRRQGGTGIRILDVGCGKGFFLRDLLAEISKGHVPVARMVGVDLVRSAGGVFSQSPSRFEFMEANVDNGPLPYADASFDFVGCNHILEHVFETERLMREIHRVLAPGGLAVVSVPNIAAWLNRILFLFGSQPLGSEVGTESTTYGFWPLCGQRRLAKFPPAGHIRDFTPRALQDLCKACGFRVVGWWNQSGTPLFPLTRWAGRAIAAILTPR